VPLACANCALDIIEGMVDDLTLDEFLDSVRSNNNENLPNLLNTTVVLNNDTDVFEVALPGSCVEQCSSGVAIISSVPTAEYEIDSKHIDCDIFYRGPMV
jgi:hypothetical protein